MSFSKALSLSLFFVLMISFIIKPAYAATITLSLTPSTKTVTINETFTVTINLATGGASTSAADIELTFDNTKLNLIDIVPGTIYGQYIGEDIDNANGRASISGLANSTQDLFSGTGTFATLTFRAIQSGTGNVSFDFTPGAGNDTN